MRLFEFVPCGGGRRGALQHDDEDVVGASVPTAAPRRTEEAAMLTCASGGDKRRRRSGVGAAGSGTWRPSLGAISEDGTGTKAKIGDRTSARRQQPARAKTKEARRAARSDREGFRHFAVPAFAPTAFLF